PRDRETSLSTRLCLQLLLETFQIVFEYPRHPRLNFREHFRRLTNITRRGRNDCFAVDVDLLTLLNCTPHVIFAHKFDGLCAVVRWGRRLDLSRWRWWRRRGSGVHASRFTLNGGRRQWRSGRLDTFAREETIHNRGYLLPVDLPTRDPRLPRWGRNGLRNRRRNCVGRHCRSRALHRSRFKSNALDVHQVKRRHVV